MNQLQFFPDRVVKTFSDQSAFEAELRVYQRSLAQTPVLLESSNLELVISRLDAKPYTDSDKLPDPALLADCISSFHLAFHKGSQTLCHWDNNPKNILWDGTRYYLIDFEDSRWASPESDISHLLMFWLGNDDLLPLIQSFLRQYQQSIKLEEDVWAECLAQSRLRFIQRRMFYHKPYPRILDDAQRLGQLLSLAPPSF